MARNSVNNVIWDLNILLKSTLKMLEMPFQRPKIQNIFGEHAPEPLEMCCHFNVTPPPKNQTS